MAGKGGDERKSGRKGGKERGSGMDERGGGGEIMVR